MDTLYIALLACTVLYLGGGAVVAAGGHHHPGKQSGVGAATWAVLLWLPVLIYERIRNRE